MQGNEKVSMRDKNLMFEENASYKNAVSEVYSGQSQTSMTELFAKIVNRFCSLHNFIKKGPKYAYTFNSNNKTNHC